jgi:hypothetical protein
MRRGVIYEDQRRMDLWRLFGMRDRWGKRMTKNGRSMLERWKSGLAMLRGK